MNARANVMVYDEQQKKWLPSGNTQGMAKVQVYHHTVNNTFRVVGRKINDHAVSFIVKISGKFYCRQFLFQKYLFYCKDRWHNFQEMYLVVRSLIM